MRSDSAAELILWDLLAGKRDQATADSALRDVQPSPQLILARFAALPSAPAEEWQQRADRMLPQPQMAAIRRLALGYALVLDGKRDAAIPVWQEAARTSAATDFFAADIPLSSKEKSRLTN